MKQLAVTPRLVFILLTLAMLWGSAFVGIKFGLESLTPGHLTLMRQLVASLCFVPFLLFTKRKLFPHWRDVPFFFLLGVLGYTIYHTTLNYGEIRVSAGTASLIIATAPAFTAIFAAFFLSERLAVFGWFGIMLSFAGVVLIVLGDNPELGFNLYALLILLSAIVTALYQTLQRPLFKTYSAVEVTAFATWAGTIPLFVFLPGFASELSTASASSLWASLYLGIFPSAIAYSLLAYAISKLPVTLVAAYLYTVPVFGLLFSWLLLGEIPSWLTVLGGLVALGGIIMVNLSKQRVTGATKT
jgi:drug/metabolite transporter (DMT)-like permease